MYDVNNALYEVKLITTHYSTLQMDYSVTLAVFFHFYPLQFGH